MAINVAPPVGGISQSQTGSIGIQDFLKILTAQLNNQDPLKPVDNAEFVAQIAQFATLEQSRQLNTMVDNLLTIQSSNQSVGLLGKTVDFNQNGVSQTGRVSALSLASGQPLMTITLVDGRFVDQVSLGQVTTIR